MAKVYVVSEGDYSPVYVNAVFSDKDTATMYAEALGMVVEEWELDPELPAEMQAGNKFYEVRLEKASEEADAHVYWAGLNMFTVVPDFWSVFPDKGQYPAHQHMPEYPKRCVHRCWAKDVEEAKAKALARAKAEGIGNGVSGRDCINATS